METGTNAETVAVAKRWRVSEVARLAHVTVRTLHHYDEIGLLVPSGRNRAGYRLYDAQDLERLHRILLYRELGFTLEAIAAMLAEPGLERRGALRAQRDLLQRRMRRTESLIRAVDRALESIERGETMSAEERFEGFEALDAPEAVREHQARHDREVKERWADTEAYRESMRRTRGYAKEDWGRIREEAEAIDAAMAALLAAGADAAGTAAMDVAERARLHIDRWFYPCSRRMHAGLAAMYESDPRFAAHYEERARGLAAFTAAAIRANAERGGADEGGEAGRA